MAKAWICDRWLKDAVKVNPGGSKTRIPPSAAVKRSLANAKDPLRAKVPEGHRSSFYGRGRRWRVKWFETDSKGVKHEKSECFSKYEEAERKVSEICDDQLSGRYVNTENAERLFSEAAEAWRLSKHDLSKSSTGSYERYMRMYVLPKWGGVRLMKISENDVNQWIVELKEGTAPYEFKEHGHKRPAKLRPKYLSLIVNTTFGAVMRYALRRGWIRTNPLENIRLSRRDPEREERRKVFLTYEEVEALAEAVEMLPHLGKYMKQRNDVTSAAVVRFMAYVGTRPGETFALRVGDVDPDSMRATISKTLTKDGDKYVEGPTKTRQVRHVAIPGFMMEELRPLMEGHGVDEYLFRARRGGGRINPDDWRNKVFYPGVIAAGLDDLEGLRPHSLRHTFASLSIAAGCDVRTLAAALGHTDVSMTLNEYAGLWPDRLDEVASALSRERFKEIS